MTTSPESLTNSKSGAGLPTSTTKSSPSRRAVGVVRVSRVGGRDGEQFVSPSEQAERIRAACERDGLTLVETIEEMDVSGGAPLERRAGLRRAVELVEAGEADVVVVAYLDRLVRSLAVQAEVVGRVEKADGAILAVDVGALTNGSAGQWLSGTMLGAVAEYARRVTAERTQDAKRRAVARGVPPFPNVPPGYRRRDDGTLEPHPTEAPIVADAFRLRAGGYRLERGRVKPAAGACPLTVMEVREHLRTNGIKRSFHGVTSMLASRVYLGELNFGKLTNPDSHPAIVDATTWATVQRMKSPRGRRAKSERLLARLGVLRCGTCGARLVVGTANNGAYPLYRCPPNADCPQRVTISAEIAERTVVEAVGLALADVAGHGSLDDEIEEAEHARAAAAAELDAAIRAFTGLEDVESARERLAELRATVERAEDRLATLRGAREPALTITAAGDWNDLTLDEQRSLVRAVVDRVSVAPGRGSDRITVETRS